MFQIRKRIKDRFCTTLHVYIFDLMAPSVPASYVVQYTFLEIIDVVSETSGKLKFREKNQIQKSLSKSKLWTKIIYNEV